MNEIKEDEMINIHFTEEWAKEQLMSLINFEDTETRLSMVKNISEDGVQMRLPQDGREDRPHETLVAVNQFNIDGSLYFFVRICKNEIFAPDGKTVVAKEGKDFYAFDANGERVSIKTSKPKAADTAVSEESGEEQAEGERAEAEPEAEGHDVLTEVIESIFPNHRNLSIGSICTKYTKANLIEAGNSLLSEEIMQEIISSTTNKQDMINEIRNRLG